MGRADIAERGEKPEGGRSREESEESGGGGRWWAEKGGDERRWEAHGIHSPFKVSLLSPPARGEDSAEPDVA